MTSINIFDVIIEIFNNLCKLFDKLYTFITTDISIAGYTFNLLTGFPLVAVVFLTAKLIKMIV